MILVALTMVNTSMVIGDGNLMNVQQILVVDEVQNETLQLFQDILSYNLFFYSFQHSLQLITRLLQMKLS